MFLQKRKRAHLTLEEKIWIVGRKQENAKLTNAKVALDFSVKFQRPISKNCVQKILGQKDKIQSILKTAPDLEVKKAKHLIVATKFEFEKELEFEIIEKPRAKRQIQQTLSKFLTANPKK